MHTPRYIVQFQPDGSRHAFFYGCNGLFTQLRLEARVFTDETIAREAIRATEGQYQTGKWAVVQLREGK